MANLSANLTASATAKWILTLDQGTTGSTASLIDRNGQIAFSSDCDFTQHYPKPGWVEHDPAEIWQSLKTAVKNCLEKAKIKTSEIAAIGITNQRETTVAWDSETGEPLAPAIVWQCRRTTEMCEKLRKQGYERKIKKMTGLVLDPYFSGTKIRWLIENSSVVKAAVTTGRARFGTVDSFLLYRLTRGAVHATDVSNASRTMLMSLKTGDYDSDLLKLFKCPREALPEIRDSSGDFGLTKGVDFLPDGIAITGIAGDQQAALFGQACFRVGQSKITFGTGSFLLVNSGQKLITSKHGLLTTVAWRLSGQKMTYALEGGAFICGAAVQWLRDELKFISNATEVEALARKVPDSAGVMFVPALTGLGAPHWMPEARGTFWGLTRGTTQSHMARAVLEALALQNADLVEAMSNDLGQAIKLVRVDGGASLNDLLMQLQSDAVGVRVERPTNIETTSLGAGYLAGLGAGFWPSTKEIEKIWSKDKEFKPELANQRRQRWRQDWQTVIKLTGKMPFRAESSS